MTYTLIPFNQEHLDPAVVLFGESYRQEQEYSPLLPTRAMGDPTWIRDALFACLENPGVAVMQDSQLAAYLITGAQFLLLSRAIQWAQARGCARLLAMLADAEAGRPHHLRGALLHQ